MAGATKEGAPTAPSPAAAAELPTGWVDHPPTENLASGAGLLGAGQTLELGREGIRYDIVRALGSGGMAQVFLARSRGPAGVVREVALKCITPGLEMNQRARRAFVHEAQLAILLRHPNIVEAYDFVEAGDRYFLVLEYIEGATLKSVLGAARREHERLSIGFCCHVAASVAEGLHYAHSRMDAGKHLAIVHRDVNPANIMIAESGAVKLLDFGIALAKVEGRDRTQTGRVRGTFAYLSPEQASRGALDGRSDLFSLGLVLVELVTGTRAFSADGDLETVQRIGECAVTDVRAATLRLPTGLSEICQKALAKRPGDRFQTGAEFSRALRDYLLAKGISYWPSDSAAEAQGLGAFAGSAVSHRNDTTTTGDEPESALAKEGERAGLTDGGERAELGAARAGANGLRRVASVALALAVLAAAALLAKHVTTGGTAVAAATRGAPASPTNPVTTALPDPKTNVREVETARPVTAPVVAETAARTSPGDEPVVRPRKKKATAVTGLHPAKAVVGDGDVQNGRRDAHGVSVRRSEKEHTDERPGAGIIAERGVPTSTLSRGTLVRARLLAPVDPTRAGSVEAVVAEDVKSAGTVLVRAGSTLVCSSRHGQDGRVPVSCEGIRAADRSWSFSGLAVGEGQHVGLRVLDRTVPAGTAFVVYVDAEFR